MVYFAAAALAPLLSFADVTLANGVRIHYAQQGPQTGPAIILLHGYSDSSFSFSRVMPLLPPELRVIAPDFRGHGDSDRPPTGYRVEDLAGDVFQLMDQLNVPSAIVVGHSMGSFVAQAMIEKAPARVTKVVLLGSAPSCDNDVVKGLGGAIEALTDPVDYQFVRDFQYSTVALPVPVEFMDAAIANSRRMPARVWREIFSGLLAYRPSSKRPSVPTLVLGGKKDTVFSAAEQIQLAGQFPGARLQLLDDVGHSLHWEQPETFVKELLRFARPNEVRLHYTQHGPKTGRAIVMLHGYSDSSFSFSRVLPLLPQDLRVIAPDLRGHGQSDRPADGYRIGDHADDVIRLMDALDVPSAVIVGHSMGSFVAQAVAERAPERVAGLVFIGSGPVAANTPLKELRAAVGGLSDPVDSGFVREFQYSTIVQPVPEAFMEAAIANSRRMPAATWKQVINGFLEYEPALPRPNVRVLVLGGTRDTVFSPAEHVALAQQYPFARLQLIDDVGHTLHWEQPGKFVELLLQFAK